MNWTGGRLQQSKRAGALSAKQKAHFAKARTHLQSGHENRSPVRFSIPGNVGYVGDDATLDRGIDPNKDEEPRGISNKAGSHAASATTPTYVSPAINLSNVQPVIFPKSRESQRKRPPSMDSQPRVRLKNKHTAHNSRLVAVEDLKAKRLELLQRNDWFGTSVARPLRIDFSSAKQRHEIGRRRKLTQTDYDRRLQGGCIRRPWEMVTDNTNSQGMTRLLVQDDKISVRIGSSIHGTQKTVGLLSERPYPPDDMLFSSVNPSEESSSILLDADPSERFLNNSPLCPLTECITPKITPLDQVDFENSSLRDIKRDSNRSASTGQKVLTFSCSPNNARDGHDSTVWKASSVNNPSTTVARTTDRDTDYTNPSLVIESSPSHLPRYVADRTAVATRNFYQNIKSRIHKHPIKNLESQPEDYRGIRQKVFSSTYLANSNGVAQISANEQTNSGEPEAERCGNGEDGEDATGHLKTFRPTKTLTSKSYKSSHCLDVDVNVDADADADADSSISHIKGRIMTEEDTLWWNFVSGETDKETDDETPKQSRIRKTANTTSIESITASEERIESPSSLVVEASQPTLTQQKHVNYSMHHDQLLMDQDPSEAVKVVFRRPTPFVGRRSAVRTAILGKTLTGSPVRGKHKSAKTLLTPSEQRSSEMILSYSSNDKEEIIED